MLPDEQRMKDLLFILLWLTRIWHASCGIAGNDFIVGFQLVSADYVISFTIAEIYPRDNAIALMFALGRRILPETNSSHLSIPLAINTRVTLSLPQPAH